MAATVLRGGLTKRNITKGNAAREAEWVEPARESTGALMRNSQSATNPQSGTGSPSHKEFRSVSPPPVLAVLVAIAFAAEQVSKADATDDLSVAEQRWGGHGGYHHGGHYGGHHHHYGGHHHGHYGGHHHGHHYGRRRRSAEDATVAVVAIEDLSAEEQRHHHHGGHHNSRPHYGGQHHGQHGYRGRRSVEESAALADQQTAEHRHGWGGYRGYGGYYRPHNYGGYYGSPYY